MKITTPKNWRKGQTIFNFLEWLRVEKGFNQEDGELIMSDTRMADPFYIVDEELDKYYEEFLKQHEN